MKDKQLTRRIIQYALGLVAMALGAVLLKQAYLGISPITSLPAAVADITPFTLGNTTIALHALCVIGQIILVRRITLKSILTLFVGFPFGYMIDGLMLIIPATSAIVLRFVYLLFGIVFQGFGVRIIVGSDLMLPAPDELTHTISQVFGKKLSNVKFASDAVYVVLALAIDLIFTHRVSSVGIGTVLSVLLTGRFVGWFTQWFPKLTLPPFWSVRKAKE